MQSLSGGELKTNRNRHTVLARASRLSVFDEPEAGIDPSELPEPDSGFERMRAKDERIHHDYLPIRNGFSILADRIVVIAEGRVITGRQKGRDSSGDSGDVICSGGLRFLA